MLTTIEKVLFLQEVDIFDNTSTEDLAFIAAITEEVYYSADNDIYQEDQIDSGPVLRIQSLSILQHEFGRRCREKNRLPIREPHIIINDN